MMHLLAMLLGFVLLCTCGCELQPPSDFHFPKRDPCCELHGGTCAWLGNYVVPVCCDQYQAHECARGQGGSGGQER